MSACSAVSDSDHREPARSLPDSSVHGIFQARILEWVAISSSPGGLLTQGSNPSLLHLLHWQVDSLPYLEGQFSRLKRASWVVLVAQNLPVNAGEVRDAGFIPGWRRSPGEGHENPLQYSCLENSHGQRSLEGYKGLQRARHD